MLRTILLFYPDWLKPSVCKTEYTIVSIRIRLPILFFFPPLFIVFWLRRKANCSGIPCKMGKGSSRWAAAPGDPAVSSSFPGKRPSPPRLPTNPALLAGDQAKFSWTPLLVLLELLENKWSLGNISVWTGWQTQTCKASRRVLFKGFSSAVSKGAMLRSRLSCNCLMPR